MPRVAKSAQKCLKEPKSAQSAQKCPECPKMSKSVQTVQKCLKWPESAQSCQTYKNPILIFFLGHPVLNPFLWELSQWQSGQRSVLAQVGVSTAGPPSHGDFFAQQAFVVFLGIEGKVTSCGLTYLYCVIECILSTSLLHLNASLYCCKKEKCVVSPCNEYRGLQ